MQQLGGIVFQFPERHFCGNTVLEELRLGHPELGSGRVKEALKEVGLDHISLNNSPNALSGGQQRRLALAVQLIRQPNLLMLDEPTAGLDWVDAPSVSEAARETEKSLDSAGCDSRSW